MFGDKDKTMTLGSKLLYTWRMELSSGQTITAELSIRADSAFDSDRGVRMPAEWCEL